MCIIPPDFIFAYGQSGRPVPTSYFSDSFKFATDQQIIIYIRAKHTLIPHYALRIKQSPHWGKGLAIRKIIAN